MEIITSAEPAASKTTGKSAAKVEAPKTVKKTEAPKTVKKTESTAAEKPKTTTHTTTTASKTVTPKPAGTYARPAVRSTSRPMKKRSSNAIFVGHKGQRVGVFVDVQNLYYSAKNLYKTKVNFSAILKTAVRGRQLIRAKCYVINADIQGENTFHEALENIGYEVHAKDLQVFFGGAKKGDWDVGIAMDIMRMALKVDVVVLVSGDGDFTDLLHHVKSLGCRTEVIAFGKTSSSSLKKECDYFTDMDLTKRMYLL